jgi:hypothetical protein
MSNFRPVDRQTRFLLPPWVHERRAAGSGYDPQAVVMEDSFMVVDTDVEQAAKVVGVVARQQPQFRRGQCGGMGSSPRGARPRPTHLSPAERFPRVPPASSSGRRLKPWRTISGATERRTITATARRSAWGNRGLP